MKHILTLFLSALFILAITVRCDTDELHDMNINPNAVQQIDMNYFMTSLLLSVSNNGLRDDRYTDWRTNLGTCATVVQQLATTGTGNIGSDGDKYMDNYPEGFNAPWDHLFNGDLRQATEIIVQTGEGGFYEGRMINTRCVARILRAFSFGRLTDWYGSIPYSEANQGLDGIFQPHYDKQKPIYMDLLKELDEACGAFNASDADYSGFKAADYVYNGDVTKWKKFGYSLMLRMAMRISNVDAATAATYVNKAVAGGTMTDNSDNYASPMSIGPSEWANQNGISRGMWPGDGGSWGGLLLSKTLVDKLKGPNIASTADDDPRLTIFTKGPIQWTASDLGTVLEADPTKWEGLPNGLDGGMLATIWGESITPYEHYCAMNPLMLQDDEVYMSILNSAECEFLKAEAVVRGIGSVSGSAQSHYEAGVKLALQQYDVYDATFVVTDGQVASYLATYPYNAATALDQIGTQLWLSKWMNWWDSWSDVRRTGFPALTATNYPGNATGGVALNRLTIPYYESGGNPNYATGATMPETLTTKVWWAGGPE
ncbi:MAG TPA: SusD/RagB family nutrient-binding outer membrane lipoprotein [Bacteroidales bacterium]|nr:SusD/RagB family nutrient-binding outer membrane lipoprotein [Bacteroidales bacterium]